MLTVCFDPITGAAGDMILASLFELGAEPEYVAEKLRTMGLAEFDLQYEHKAGQDGVVYGFCQVIPQPDQHQLRDHEHSPAQSEPEHHHHHRHLKDILEMIDRGDFPERVKDRAAAVFRRLAEAEGAVHGASPQDVHFHEVGAVDSIVDIVGACLALEQLQVDSIYVSSFKIGQGIIECEHGNMPVPAPATAKLLEDSRVQRLNIESELTTPTGAALLTTLSDGDWDDLNGRIIRVGTGHGKRYFEERPNILRAYLMELPPAPETVEVIECDLDDQTPEMTALLADHLRSHGAIDVVTLPIMMKKKRNGIRLSVLSPLRLTEHLSNQILGHSSTIGVRIYAVRRFLLPRHSVTVETPWGVVQAKKIERPTGTEIVPEADACAKTAENAGIPARRVADWVRSWSEQER